MLIVDAAAVRMLDLLEESTFTPAMKVIEGSVTRSERQHVRVGLLATSSAHRFVRAEV